MKLSGARNLLTEFRQSAFDPLDAEVEACGIPHVLAAASGTGKTDFLTTVGQLCYLAQCGCPIAASEAQVPLFGAYLTHLSLEEDKRMQRSFFYKSVESLMGLLQQKERNEQTLNR